MTNNELPDLSAWHRVPVGATIPKGTPYAYTYGDGVTVELDGNFEDFTLRDGDYTYYTEEPRITRVCRAIGYEPMPYQRYVWAVGTEYRRDSLGRKVYHYPDVLVSTPRQSGKTTLLRPVRVSRMIEHAGSKLFSTAQTQKHASKRMLDSAPRVSGDDPGPGSQSGGPASCSPRERG